MRQVEIAIEKMANGGAGFGRHEGKAFFVPFTAPGDVAHVQIACEKKNYAEANLLELSTASTQRVTPLCPVFGQCGGCNWQHLDYMIQISAKTQIFAELLWHSGRFSPELVPPVLPAPDPYGYRSRIQLKVGHQKGRVHLGFFRPKSHQIIDIPSHCAIAHKSINATLEGLRMLLHKCPHREDIKQVDVARGDNDCISVIMHCSATSIDAISDHLLQHKEDSGFADSLFVRQGRNTRKIYGPEHLCYRIHSKTTTGHGVQTMFFSKDAFSQINYQQNLQLINVVTEFAALCGRERVLDLYCGNGNFSIPLAGSAAHVTGFEGYEPSISDAKRNAEYNGVSNVCFHCSDSLAAVKNLAATGETFDVVVLDPPRSGAMDVVPHIPTLRPDRIIYVSCDPATLARDLSQLKKDGYHIQKSQGVDMFPQTYHLESVTLLTKS